jgi:hypothetical protein
MRSVLTLLLLPALYGCATTEYYWQGIRGELDILERAQPVPAVIETTSDATLKRKLERSVTIRDYASRELALPDNGSYRSYAEIGRRFVLWNVIATPELSLEPRHWCFPIAGCVNYRGFSGRPPKGEATKFGLAATMSTSAASRHSPRWLSMIRSSRRSYRYPDQNFRRLSFTNSRIRSPRERRQRVQRVFAVRSRKSRRALSRPKRPGARRAPRPASAIGKASAGGRTRGRLAALYASDASDETAQ